MDDRLKQQSGVSLIETLIAMTLSLLIIGFGWDFGSKIFDQFSRLEHRVEAQQQARIGLDMLVHEIKTAGHGLPHTHPAFLSINPTSIRFESNLEDIETTLSSDTMAGSLTLSVENGQDFPNGKSILICSDGSCEKGVLLGNGNSSQITLTDSITQSFPAGSSVHLINTVYYYVNQNNQLLRRIDQGGANEVANNLQALELEFFNTKGMPTWDPLSVKRVKISLVAQYRSGPPRNYSTMVGIRNR